MRAHGRRQRNNIARWKDIRRGCWSPADGDRFVYTQVRAGTPSLMVMKTSGEATPTVLEKIAAFALPQWSPDGQWIAYQEATRNAARGGWSLISPDGRTTRSFPQIKNRKVTFSSDFKLLYGIRDEQDHNYLSPSR